MSLILAIPCADRIVVAADGRRVDYDTGNALADIMKIHELTSNSAILIAGNGLIDEFDEYMHGLVDEVRKRGNQNIADIAKDVKEVLDKRNWAEWKDNFTESHIEALAVGYDGDRPAVYCIMDNRDFVQVWAGIFGGSSDTKNYLANNVSSDYRKNTAKLGNKVAVEVLSRAENANNKEIGGQYAVWHVLLSAIHKLKASDIANLRSRYSKRV